MKSSGWVRGFTLAAAAALLAACGSSSNNNASTNGGTSAGTTAFTRGVITAFGSVHLGDDVFNTTASTVRKRLDDGADNLAGDDRTIFKEGMVVEIFHKSDDKNAVEIRFKDDLEGPITALCATGSGCTFNVLGVPVLVDTTTTKFDTSRGDNTMTLAALAPGNVVEVSGLFDANGVLRATFIEGKRLAARLNDTFETKGNITSVSGTAPNQLIKVNGVEFQMSASTQTSDLPASGLAVGQFVEVKTTSTTAPFAVTKIEGAFEDPENEVRGADKAAVEGFVTNLTGTSPNFTFKLGNTSVTTSSSTTGVAAVAAGAHIEAEGPVNASGVISALTIGTRP